jgi:hypothetical protein
MKQTLQISKSRNLTLYKTTYHKVTNTPGTDVYRNKTMNIRKMFTFQHYTYALRHFDTCCNNVVIVLPTLWECVRISLERMNIL